MINDYKIVVIQFPITPDFVVAFESCRLFENRGQSKKKTVSAISDGLMNAFLYSITFYVTIFNGLILWLVIK